MFVNKILLSSQERLERCMAIDDKFLKCLALPSEISEWFKLYHVCAKEHRSSFHVMELVGKWLFIVICSLCLILLHQYLARCNFD